jgi:hypothetical protein
VSVLVVELYEVDEQASDRARQQAGSRRADYVWMTPAVDRPDPCLAFRKK